MKKFDKLIGCSPSIRKKGDLITYTAKVILPAVEI